jgi:hypothetical protein
MGSGFDVMINDINDEKQVNLQQEIRDWMDSVYQDAYTVGLNHLLDIMVDNALTEGFAAAEIVYSGESGNLFDKYAKPLTTSMMSQESGKLAKTDYSSYDIKDPDWKTLGGVARLKIILDSPTRLKLYRRNNTWEADYWVLDQPNVAGAQAGMTSAAQKNVTQGPAMQLTTQDLVTSTMAGGGAKSSTQGKPSAYFLPWQMFTLSMSRRTWLEKGPSIILPALKTAQLLEKIMNAVGEGIYRAGNKKYFIICGSPQRPWGAIHIRNLLSQIKDASEKNWSTIPVPAGFDLKEAGGNVFEAQNAINYFLRIIAGIMHVNPSVMGLDTREARNVTEYPYFTHLRMKEELMNQIRTQLVRLQIWTTHGAKITKQGGYMDPQWIPKLRVKTEDLLNPADRLNLDIAILNAANPVMPQTKLEVERDIIATRGWEVDLPTQQEFMKELNDQKKQQKDLADATTKAQLENLKNHGTTTPPPNGNGGNGNGQPNTTQQPKTMGPPNPPSSDKQQKKIQNSTSKTGKKGNNPRGTTRKPKEAKNIQESLITNRIAETLAVEESVPASPQQTGSNFMIANPFASTASAGSNEFSPIQIVITQLSGESGDIARYNKDLSKIYIDEVVPSKYYKPIIAHEIFQWIAEFELHMSFEKAEKMATDLEDEVATNLGLNPEVYERDCRKLEAEVSKRVGVKDPDDVVEHKEVGESEEEEIESAQPTQKLEITVKAEPIKTDITIKEDPEKKKADDELREKKKKLLDNTLGEIEKKAGANE